MTLDFNLTLAKNYLIIFEVLVIHFIYSLIDCLGFAIEICSQISSKNIIAILGFYWSRNHTKWIEWFF